MAVEYDHAAPRKMGAGLTPREAREQRAGPPRRAGLARARNVLQREQGAIHKDWGGRLSVALAYPNTYWVGMSSLAVHTVYRLFNERRDTVCERAFWALDASRRAPANLPLVPEAGARRETGDYREPVIALESQRPLSDFAVIAFSISYELDYFHVVQMLRCAGIPLFTQQRDESWPLIIAGGPAVTSNPEPLADIIDAFVIGEAEALADPLLVALQEASQEQRRRALELLANVPGVYVPAAGNAPVARVWQRDLVAAPATTLVFTPDTEFGDRGLIEIGRGCWRGCRFCLAGFTYRPVRYVGIDAVLAAARRVLDHRDRVGLVSAAVSDHPQIDRIATDLRRMGARIAISSMRVDPISEPLIQALAESSTRTLTIAPEAGSPRLRQVIGKPQGDDQLLYAVDMAARYGFPQLKMYFMIGQPTETDADVEAIADLTLAARARFPRSLVITATPHVPKAHTPFQWTAMLSVEALTARIRYLEKRLRPARVMVRSDSPAWAAVEGVLARGDRRLGLALADMSTASLREWQRALRQHGLSTEEYLRERSLDEPLPWSVVRCAAAQDYLATEMRRSQEAALCHEGEAAQVDSRQDTNEVPGV